MTANELAVDLELQSSQMEYGYAVSDWKLLSEAATMLRQQQAKIDELNNPIFKAISLAFNELTDAEIEHIAQQHLTVHVQFIGAGDCTIEGEIEFARAIIKKAGGG